MPKKEIVLRWYAKFKEELEQQGIDINNSLDLLRIKGYKGVNYDLKLRGEVFFPLDSKNTYKKKPEENDLEEFEKKRREWNEKFIILTQLSQNIEDAMKDESKYKFLSNLYLEYDKAAKEAEKAREAYKAYTIQKFSNFAGRLIFSMNVPDENDERHYSEIEELYNLALNGMLTIEPPKAETNEYQIITADEFGNLTVSEKASSLLIKNENEDYELTEIEKNQLEKMAIISITQQREINVFNGEEIDEDYAIERFWFLNLLRENSKEPDYYENDIIRTNNIINDQTFNGINEVEDIIKQDRKKIASFKTKLDDALDLEFKNLQKDIDYQAEKMKDLDKYVEKNAEYSIFEFENTKAKQMLKELTLEYKQYIGNDPELAKIIDKVEKYSNLDAHAGKNFFDERDYLNTIMEQLDDYYDTLDKEEAALNKEMHKFYDKVVDENNMTGLEKKKDAELSAKMQLIDNRRRIHASLSNYFEILTSGKLQVPYSDDIDKAMEKPYGMAETDEYKFINGKGVEVLQTIDFEELKDFKILQNVITSTSSVKNQPIFQHEPRMNDIQQCGLGNCYMLAGLQEVARLYPEKIKESIRDNNDGTATVRLFEKVNGNYKPVYVRVDKMESKITTVNQGNEYCLWATLIERAYAISGIHYHRDNRNNSTNIKSVPNFEELKRIAERYNNSNDKNISEDYKPWININNGRAEVNWKPDLNQIEGGNGADFLEAFLGEDFKSSYKSIKETTLDAWFNPVQGHRNTSEDILKLLIAQCYKYGNNDKEKEEFVKNSVKKSFDDLLTLVIKNEYSKILNDEDVDNKLDMDDEEIKLAVNFCKRGLLEMQNKIDNEIRQFGNFLCRKNSERALSFTADLYSRDNMDNGIEDNLTSYKVNEVTKAIFNRFKQPIKNAKDSSIAVEQPRIDLFDEICENLDKGFPSMLGSKQTKEINISSGHEYSILGAYTTNDNPPRKFLRLRNPWGNRKFGFTHGLAAYIFGKNKGINDSGLDYYTDDKGHEKFKFVSMEDGIFDIEFELACQEFDGYSVCKSDNLEHTPAIKTDEYTIKVHEQDIKPEEMNEELFRDYLKVANDLVKDITNTESILSKDPDEFTALLKDVKDFKDIVVKNRKGNISEVVNKLNNLSNTAQSYIDCLPKDGSRSDKQTSREKIGNTIKFLNSAVKDNKTNPRKAFEVEFAEKMLTEYYKKNNINIDENKFNENVTKLLVNRGFHQIVEKNTISKLHNADKAMITKSIEEFANITKGYARDQGFDLTNMEKKEKASIARSK